MTKNHIITTYLFPYILKRVLTFCYYLEQYLIYIHKKKNNNIDKERIYERGRQTKDGTFKSFGQSRLLLTRGMFNTINLSHKST